MTKFLSYNLINNYMKILPKFPNKQPLGGVTLLDKKMIIANLGGSYGRRATKDLFPRLQKITFNEFSIFYTTINFSFLGDSLRRWGFVDSLS